MEALFIVLAVVAGVGVTFQAATNAALGKFSQLGAFSALCSFLCGLPIVLVYYAVESKGFSRGNYNNIPIWAYVGGFLGAFYVITIIVSVPKLGASTVLALTIGAQVITGIMIDHFGILELEKREATAGRICGGVIMIIGAVLIAVF